ncbi:TPA: hypothetical protein ACPZT9_000357 [Yersinia enterocolitica]
MNKHIDELKRFIYSATVTSGSGSQSFYIDAKNREEADARAANKESDGMYADDSEVTDLDAFDYEDETTVDDFGDFPPISREQSLLAQLESTQKEITDWRSIAEAAAQDDADWHRLVDSKNEVIAQLAKGIIKLKDRAEAAEARLLVPEVWIKCSDQLPDPNRQRRVCVFTPHLFADMRYRLVPANLFKAICSSATHWHYVNDPVEGGE